MWNRAEPGTYSAVNAVQMETRPPWFWHTGRVQPPLIVLVGPTASGKTTLAVEVASTLRGRGHMAEIINADSMLIYRGMDIGTAKPTLRERGDVPHHLIDIAEVTERASVAWFQRQARAVIAARRGAGVIPVLVGGSALYTRAILDHFDFPGSDERVRARWEAELVKAGARALHARLAEISPASAAKIDPGNGRRIVRALEVEELTGGHRPSLPRWSYAVSDVHQFGLWADRSVLDQRIDQRVDRMWQAGLVDEVRMLLGEGLRESSTASRAIGYRQVVDYLDGKITEEQAKAEVKRATRTFFRKQLAWYRRDPRITWLEADADDNPERILGAVGLGGASEGDQDAQVQLP